MNFEIVGVGTFYEASSQFRYRKIIFDAKKVTYNTYSCSISGMSREIKKIDGRDSAEFQIWVMNGHNGHLEICLSHKKTKNGNSDLSSPTKIRKNVGKGNLRSSGHFRFNLEREPQASL